MTKNVLLCLDAFGTLFRPKYAVHKQYGDVARRYGLGGFGDDELATSFKSAFKEESRANPNYGRATDLGSTKWWTNVIEKTFRPYLSGDDKKLPPVLAPALLHRFSSKEGYDLYEDAQSLLQYLAGTRGDHTFSRIGRHDSPRRLIVGVITNSDDRVPDILTSFGLKLNPLKQGDDPRPYHLSGQPADIDFTIMSYDVGHEKPDRLIFDAATTMLQQMLKAEGHKDFHLSEWRQVYVGDEFDKDARGAARAGWDAVWIDRERQSISEEAADVRSSQVARQRTLTLDEGGEVVVIDDLMTVSKLLE